MSNYRVASRYAKSLIELSQEKGILEAIKDDMILFQSTIRENRDLALMLKSPILVHSKKSEVLKSIFSDKVHELTSMFFNIICKKGRESLLDGITAEFLNQYNEVKGILTAKIITATPLNSAGQAKVISAVKAATNANEVKLEMTVDDSIIGGYILKLNDTQVDDSIQGRLDDLRNTLIA